MSRLLQRLGTADGGTVDLLRVDKAPLLEFVVTPRNAPPTRVTLPASSLRDLVDAIRDELDAIEQRRK